MAVEWKEFLQEVLPDVAGCPIRVAENAIRNSAIAFCGESRAWRADIDDVVTVQGTSVYPLVGPVESEVDNTYYAKFTDSNIPLGTIPEQHLARGRQNPNQSKPKWFHCPTPDTIELFWVPDAIYTLNVKAIMSPTRASTGGPDFLYNDWLEEIAHGAKGRLQMMVGRDWYEPKIAAWHRKQFIAGWVEARIRDAKSNVQSSTRARPGYFGTYRGSKSI